MAPGATAQQSLDAGILAGVKEKPPHRLLIASVHRPPVKREEWERHGLEPLFVLYQSQLWSPDSSVDEPDEQSIRSSVKEARPNALVCLDIEHWHTGPIEVKQTLRKLIRVIGIARQERPDCKFGFYGLLPQRDYWTPVQGKPTAIAKWQARNNALQPLVDYVDVLFPSLYTFYPDQKGWKRYAVENLAEAQRLANGKPVYPFLWDVYHPSAKQPGEARIPKAFLDQQVETCLENADGLVWWTGMVRDGYAEFDPNTAWMRATSRWLPTNAARGGSDL